MKTYVKRLSAVILLLIIAAVPYIDDAAKAAEQKILCKKSWNTFWMKNLL
ncbi:hypothetical protein QNN00_15990 [Bacillus velezensis]|nr:hypothetical protein [Bacillus velezensis]